MENKIDKFKVISRFLGFDSEYLDKKIENYNDSDWKFFFEIDILSCLTDWDWIFDVIEKLKEEGSKCTIDSLYVSIDNPKVNKLFLVYTSDYTNVKEAAVDCCYMFIKEYNKSLLIEEDV